MKVYLLFASLIVLSCSSIISCEHFERRKKQETMSSDSEGNYNQREVVNKSKIRDYEKKLLTRQEKQLYSKLLPWFLNDEERIAFLNKSSFEDKQTWIQNSGILSRQNSLGKKFKKTIDSQDIAIGMPNELVKKSWGEPLQVEISGNPLFLNEKWRYLRNISSAEGFRQERRTVYFENGKVVGWETE